MKNNVLLLILVLFISNYTTAQSQFDIKEYNDKIKSKFKENLKKDNANYFDSKSIKQIKLDSIERRVQPPSVVQNDVKIIFEYNDLQDISQNIEYIYDQELNDWYKKSRIDYSYGINGKIIEYIYYSLNRDNDSLELSFKISIDDISETSSIEYRSTWDKEKSEWILSSKTEYEYNQELQLLSQYYYEWDSAGSDWKNINSEIYTYDDKFLTDSVWTAYSTEEYSYDYDDKSRILNRINNTYIYEDDELEIASDEYEYNDRDSITMHLWNFMRVENDVITFSNNIKRVNKYDSDGYLISKVTSGSEHKDSLFIFKEKIEHTIEKGNYLLTESYLWDDMVEDWVSIETIDYELDLNYKKEDVAFPDFRIEIFDPLDFKSKNIILQSLFTDTRFGSSTETEINYFYSDIDVLEVGIEDEFDRELLIYPNPTNNGIIRFGLQHTPGLTDATLKIFAQSGNLLSIKRISEKMNKVDLSAFSNGLYYYTINDNKKVIQSGKIILK